MAGPIYMFRIKRYVRCSDEDAVLIEAMIRQRFSAVGSLDLGERAIWRLAVESAQEDVLRDREAAIEAARRFGLTSN